MTKKSQNKTKALTKRKKEKELIWAGAQTLLGKPANQKEIRERALIMKTAEILEVVPLGVNILGSMPYINNIGLRELLEQFEKEKKIKTRIEFRWAQRSLTDTDKAVCEARIVDTTKIDKADRILVDWITGEASPATIKMGTLKGYQNHLAQIRAENRAIRHLLGRYAIKKIVRNIAKKRTKDDPEIIEKAANVMATSAEEISKEKVEKTKPHPVIETRKVDPVMIAANYIKGVKSEKMLKACEKNIKQNDEFTEENKVYLLNLIERQRKKYADTK